jgi:hypothetical protein
MEIDGKQTDVIIFDGYGDEVFSPWRMNFVRFFHTQLIFSSYLTIS